MCTAPTADCDANPSNGCEVNLSNDPSNCGQCGYTCVGGACQSSACVLAQPGNITYTFGDFEGRRRGRQHRERLSRRAQANVQCVALDATSVYGATFGGTQPC